MGKLGGAAKVAAGAVVAAVAAVGTALVSLSKNTQEYRTEQAKLLTAFQAAGAGAAEATEAYNGLYRFLGKSDVAVEAAAHLAKLTTNQQELADWTTACQGIYATFGDSLPIEGLTEAANETAKVGTVTGTLADALNWAGVNEDAFNNSLAACNNEAEREKLIRETLNGLYYDAAQLYEKNNKEMIEANEAQASLDAITGHLGKVVTPLVTALTNLSSVLLQALAPAISFISSVMSTFINKVVQAVQWINNLITALTGSKQASAATATISSNMGSAASGAGDLTNNINAATKAAEKLKRSTASFDELNKVSSSTSSGSDSGSSGSGAGSIGSVGALDTSGLDSALDSSSSKIDSFVAKVKTKIDELKTAFAPTISAWSSAFDTIAAAWDNSKINFTNGITNIKDGFLNVASYLVNEFAPNIINSFSTNLAPAIGDIFAFMIEDVSKNFEFFGTLINNISKDIITPALESIETVTTGVFKAIGDTWSKHGTNLLNGVTTFFDGIREDINEFYTDVILPIWQKIKEVFDKVWTEGLEPLVREIADAALEIGTCLITLYNEKIKPIVDWLQQKIYPIIVKIINWVTEKVGEGVIAISGSIKGVITTLKGIIQFITGVFTGDWKKAWEGVKNIFKGIFDTLYNVVKVPLNTIIGGINVVLKGITSAVNTAIKAINKISVTVPDWVPEIGGKRFGFNIKELTAPQIPKLATGGIVTSATQLIAGEAGKEAILPLENNTGWMDILADRLAARNSSPSKIVLMLDSKELGWANIESINSITRQTGSLQLALV